MAKKKKKRVFITIPLTLIIGIVALLLIWMMYDFQMMVRYILGGIVFATVTIIIIKEMKKHTGKKKFTIRI